MCPISDVLLMDENIITFSNKTFQALSFEKKIHIKFWVNIWNHGKNLQDLSGQTPCIKEG